MMRWPSGIGAAFGHRHEQSVRRLAHGGRLLRFHDPNPRPELHRGEVGRCGLRLLGRQAARDLRHLVGVRLARIGAAAPARLEQLELLQDVGLGQPGHVAVLHLALAVRIVAQRAGAEPWACLPLATMGGMPDGLRDTSRRGRSRRRLRCA